jgi:hypothetical protein
MRKTNGSGFDEVAKLASLQPEHATHISMASE